MSEKEHIHESNTKLKQKNKHHKSKGSKRSIKGKGKISNSKGNIIKRTCGNSFIKSKASRKNKAKQDREDKRNDIIMRKREASKGSPRIIGIIPIGNVDSLSILNDFNQHQNNSKGITLRFISSKNGSVESAIDVAICSDSLIFAILAEDGSVISDIDRTLVSSVISISSAPIHCLVHFSSMTGLGCSSLPSSRSIKSFAQVLLNILPVPSQCKLHSSHSPAQIEKAIRSISSTSIQPSSSFMTKRSHITVDDFSFNDFALGEDHPPLLFLSGFIRNCSLDLRSLIHFTDIDDFQIHSIQDGLGNIVESDLTQRESLILENPRDPFASEQTWPTEEEIAEADQSRALAVSQSKRGDAGESNAPPRSFLDKPTRPKIVPKGTSEYLAAWLAESDHSSDGDLDEDEVGDYREIEMEEQTEVKVPPKTRENLDQQVVMDIEFPDEIDTPINTPARHRFARYRGMQSSWDPKESLPEAYSRIFQFDNFPSVQKSILKDSLNSPIDAIASGSKVVLGVSMNDGTSDWDASSASHVGLLQYERREKILQRINAIQERGSPLLVTRLFPWERRVSVLHFRLLKHPSYTETISAKDEYIFQCGFRRFLANPIFSEININSDTHKYEKFLHAKRATAASIIGPVLFGSCPLLMFKRNGQTGNLDLVATGTLLSVDPDRIVLKKIVLTGYPHKIHKRRVVVRDMFYNSEDVDWFTPIELRTKFGRVGRIIEPLGTHGLMKCQFNTQPPQNDTICLNLYKRVFPKWTGRARPTE